MFANLLPLAIGAAGVWLVVRWRDARALMGRARTSPATPGVGWGVPAASGSASESPPMFQFPGTFDEFSSMMVSAGGDVPVEQSAVAPNELATVTLVDDPPLALRDTVSAMPVASLEEDTIGSIPRSPVFALPWLRPEPRLEPDHNPYAAASTTVLGAWGQPRTVTAPQVAAPTSGPGSSTVPGHVVQPLAAAGAYIGAPGKDPQKVAARIIEQVTGRPPKGGKK